MWSLCCWSSVWILKIGVDFPLSSEIWVQLWLYAWGSADIVCKLLIFSLSCNEEGKPENRHLYTGKMREIRKTLMELFLWIPPPTVELYAWITLIFKILKESDLQHHFYKISWKSKVIYSPRITFFSNEIRITMFCVSCLGSLLVQNFM